MKLLSQDTYARAAAGRLSACLCVAALATCGAATAQHGTTAGPGGNGQVTPEKDGRTKAQAKLDSRLRAAIERSTGTQTGRDTPRRSGAVDIDEAGRVLVDIEAAVSSALTGAIEAAGGQVVNQFPAYHAIRARVLLAELEGLAERPDVKFIRTAENAVTNVPAGNVR